MPDSPISDRRPRSLPEETRRLGELLDDPVTDPADEERRRAAVDAALLTTSDETLGEHVERLIAIGRKAWDLDRNVAEELAQEALTRVLEHRRKWDPRRGSLYQFLKGVLHSLVDAYFESGPLNHDVHLQRTPDRGGGHDLETEPEGNLDPYENLADPAAGSSAYSTNPEQVLIAQQTWEQDKADFALVTRRFAKDTDAMAVIRAAQKDVRKAEDQAEHAKIPVERVNHARRRITLFLRAMYKTRSERPRLERAPVRPTRRAGEAGARARKTEPDAPDTEES